MPSGTRPYNPADLTAAEIDAMAERYIRELQRSIPSYLKESYGFPHVPPKPKT